MKKILLSLVAAVAIAGQPVYGENEKLVILHTNDTHSQIDPNEKNLGGIVRRKVLVDSVRAAEKNVVLIDAGDAVQGTLYFSLFGGAVENKMMNALGYDIQILGNHEFDNGMDALAKYVDGVNAVMLTSNYRLDKSTLAGKFRPYVIKQFGDRRVGIIAINLIPKGMIADANTVGVEYIDGIKTANSFAWILKHYEGVDVVVAVTHVGYEHQPGVSDVDLARNSEDIDVIIGGHSHTLLNPNSKSSKPCRIPNLKGDSVLVAQMNKGGVYLGEITIDLSTGAKSSRLIPVDSRLDSRIDVELAAELAPYRAAVDSVMSIPVGRAAVDFPTSEPGLLNLASDFVRVRGSELVGETVDLGVMNKGGLRRSLPKGTITKGSIMQIMPFDNKVEVIELSGSDLAAAMDVMASRHGDGVSSNVKAKINPETGRCETVTIDGKPIVPNKIYRIATIDYLANGGDYMVPFTKGEKVALSQNVVYDDFIKYLQSKPMKGKKLRPDNTKRMSEE